MSRDGKAWWRSERMVWGRRGPGYTDQVFFDVWTLVHLFFGALLWKLGVPPTYAVIILVLFELWENSAAGTAFFRMLPKAVPSLRGFAAWDAQSEYRGDSWGNAAFDILAGVGAYYLMDLTGILGTPWAML
jgi:hypothetical protein